MMPAARALSRRFEKQADAYALGLIPDPGTFISAMNRLAALNGADRAPHPAIEGFFFSHPSIDRRIRFAQSFRV